MVTFLNGNRQPYHRYCLWKQIYSTQDWKPLIKSKEGYLAADLNYEKEEFFLYLLHDQKEYLTKEERLRRNKLKEQYFSKIETPDPKDEAKDTILQENDISVKKNEDEKNN